MTTDDKQRITLFINPSIVKQARAQAVVEDLSLTSLVENALINYLPKETVIKKADIKVDIGP
ncbi:MAG: hypothetical protein UV61_C0001G0016 [Candidatus Gottesmanbacteria bacterium GW2011_GWB1_43_11]|uniref:CopG family transcriptional regulator n=1 Tax=Candidatus Gottesmanbacteria bacterium GW2011_GWB1_43_11 TaxID=1618446 RepID=A0A0G1CQ11_9BACT|nr:MAG: hypothetical protein UV04_C0016G0015 [Candidatus Gottesmanbacteria bacterium GW2011_GWA2_42_16]KKS52448.1 MAG: hypothetical protein UV17_C0045G0008 [Candidatus Gottesmanbacteria bacterium GW2011_GWA1_42_26]KKS81532.1 MAG: hypothetical protein UV55_C0012G0016 [Candidatus Gottesmanbacteria bacterium GW2011_GWC1_43_10]KKS87609.1 MAG: hypothetical protein UV61_C0001G0016 [Candidatus Gottesmanbacteria bacterium GW2011_GWB1_43_11]OGG10074.1 MAG: hypothetical protein A2699_06035 [Candidatus Go